MPFCIFIILVLLYKKTGFFICQCLTYTRTTTETRHYTTAHTHTHTHMHTYTHTGARTDECLKGNPVLYECTYSKQVK